MKYEGYIVMAVIIASVLLSGCSGKNNSYYPKPYGEDWKVYPFVEVEASRTRARGISCWENDPSNSQGLCY